MNWAAIATLVALLCGSIPLGAVAQVPLAVGIVRDQHGLAVPDAVVRVAGGPASGESAPTDASGTFVLRGLGIERIEVSCKFCAPLSQPVQAGEPIVAIVHRYDALASTAPSSDDIANLPYDHIESTMALRPFTLLTQTTTPFPGDQLSDRGLSANGSLLVDDGVANYDVVAGTSPYVTIPARFEAGGTLESASQAYAYGNQASGGTLVLTPFDNGSMLSLAQTGSDTTGRVQLGTGAAQFVAGTYSNSDESRQRTDASFDLPIDANENIGLLAGVSQGYEFGNSAESLGQSFSFARATFEDRGSVVLDSAIAADRGSYDAIFEGAAFTSMWSDTQIDTSLRTRGPIAAFVSLDSRFSTGSYDSASQADPYASGTLAQQRITIGANTRGAWYDLSIGGSQFWIAQATSGDGDSQYRDTAHPFTPSIDLSLFPEHRWNVELQNGGSFEAPTFVQQDRSNGYGAFLQQDWLDALSLSYTDNARLRATAQAATESIGGNGPGRAGSAGLGLTWQIAPLLSLRAWTMHVSDSSTSYGGSTTSVASAPTVSSFWATYENAGALRVDAIYRQDVLDISPFWHLDADVSGPLGRHLRWYVGSEDRMHVRTVDTGAKFAP